MPWTVLEAGQTPLLGSFPGDGQEQYYGWWVRRRRTDDGDKDVVQRSQLPASLSGGHSTLSWQIQLTGGLHVGGRQHSVLTAPKHSSVTGQF